MNAHRQIGKQAFVTMLLITAGILFLSSCGNFYSADIQGYVLDSESNTGINGVTIYLFEKEPELPQDENFFTKTSTANFNGEAGYYSSKVIWQSLVGRFGPEGDSGEIYMGVSHPDYADVVITQRGIFSDTNNILEDIELDRTTFSSPLVSGRVVNSSGEGVNGVRMVLDLDSTPDENEDYVALSGTVEDTIGVFEFTDVTWTDETAAAEGTSSTENVTISVDDNEWKNSGQPRNLDLYSSQESVLNDISINRQPRSNFQMEITGRIVDRKSGDNPDYPIEGILVELIIDTDDTSGSGYEDPEYALTDINGRYTFNIQWDDNSPGDFPSGASGSIPEGEDGIEIISVYADWGDGTEGLISPDGNYGQPAGGTSEVILENVEIHSGFNPYTVPLNDPDSTN